MLSFIKNNNMKHYSSIPAILVIISLFSMVQSGTSDAKNEEEFNWYMSNENGDPVSFDEIQDHYRPLRAIRITRNDDSQNQRFPRTPIRITRAPLRITRTQPKPIRSPIRLTRASYVRLTK
uniref:Uncharacterized protein n=1 Tax=Lepeophtheirus salmonis TaxID=72036 RepID=A0A0K2TPS0_LEPSM